MNFPWMDHLLNNAATDLQQLHIDLALLNNFVKSYQKTEVKIKKQTFYYCKDKIHVFYFIYLFEIYSDSYHWTTSEPLRSTPIDFSPRVVVELVSLFILLLPVIIPSG